MMSLPDARDAGYQAAGWWKLASANMAHDYMSLARYVAQTSTAPYDTRRNACMVKEFWAAYHNRLTGR